LWRGWSSKRCCFEKKQQKTFDSSAAVLMGPLKPKGIKNFLPRFFLKKRVFPSPNLVGAHDPFRSV
jgi:hypothetical protein